MDAAECVFVGDDAHAREGSTALEGNYGVPCLVHGRASAFGPSVGHCVLLSSGGEWVDQAIVLLRAT